MQALYLMPLPQEEHGFLQGGIDVMKWYYMWRLNRVRATIAMLENETRASLAEDYTAHSRLRVLTRLAEGLEQRLAKVSGAPPETAAGGA